MPVSSQIHPIYTPEHIESVLDQLTAIQIHLSPDPFSAGPNYITKTIAAICNAVNFIDPLLRDVKVAIANVKKNLNLLQFEARQRFNEAITSVEITNLDCSFTEKTHQAEGFVDEVYEQEHPGSLSMRVQLSFLECQLNDLEFVFSCVCEKKSHLKQLDSAVRLQQREMADQRLFDKRSGGQGGPIIPVLEKRRRAGFNSGLSENGES